MQTTVNEAMAVGREGAVADLSATHIVSKVCEDTNGDIKPGRVVTKGASVRQAVLPNATGEISGGVVEGITAWVQGREPGGALGQYLDKETMAVVRRGKVWMIAEDVCTYGNAVFVRFEATSPEELGRVRSDADTADAVELPTAQFRGTTTGVNQLILVEINLP